MASELSGNETFFNGLMNDTNFQIVESELLKAVKTRENPGRKSSRKPKSPNGQKNKPTNRGKENVPATQAGNKKVSRKSTKEPLKAIVPGGKSPKKPAEDATPSKRKSVRKETSAPAKAKPSERKSQIVPKIVVYEDNSCKEGEEKRGRRNGRRVSKSWEGRRSLAEGRKSPRVAAGPKRVRHSFNDLPSLKSPKKKEKLPRGTSEGERDQKQNLKPTDPEFVEMLAKLEILFPGIDPEFLKSQFVKFKGSLPKTIEFILLKEKTDALPTRADYMRRVETEKLERKFLESFSVENFLKMIPDPWDYFLKAERHNCVNYSGHSLHYLKNKFKKHYIQAIQDALVRNNHSLYLANKELNRKNRLLKMRATNRSKNECDQGKPLTFDIQFIHEVAFIENEMKIKVYLKKAELAKQKQFEKAQREGTLLECQSCNELSLLRDDAVLCPANHVFCKDCLVKYLEIEIEKDNYQFKCLMKCEEKFTLDSLQAVLSPVVMARIIKRNQIGEIKSAGIEEFVCCPFCYYITELPPELSLLKCLNPNCLKESCRHCKQLNHIPLKCHELENFQNTLLLETETESSLRCIHCNKEFVKREDSNKMDCPCGATMCSVCRQPFPECPHFKRPDDEPSTRLSSTSDDTEFTEAGDDPGEGDPRWDPPPPTDDFQFHPSSSDSF